MTELRSFVTTISVIAAFASPCARTACALADETEPPHTLRWNPQPQAGAPADTSALVAPKTLRPDAAGAIDDGQLLPFTVGAPIARSAAVVKALGGYDTTTRSARARTSGEASVTNFLALRLEYEHGPGTGSDDRVTLGARVAVLSQGKHGIDGGFGFLYDAKDFRNEGNFVGALMLGRRFGKLGVYGNALFGMDSEGDDESAELRLGGGYRLLPSLELGLDARGRVNMSSDSKRVDAQSVDWELQGGALAALSVGPIAIIAIAGPSFLRVAEAHSASSHLDSGIVALGGAGAAF